MKTAQEQGDAKSISDALKSGKAMGDYLAETTMRQVCLDVEAYAQQPAQGEGYTDLRSANVARAKIWNAGVYVPLSFRGNEMAGEVGEACNIIKKLERERMGLRGSRATKEQLAEELADVVITADLTAMDAEIDLDAAIRNKFNATSEKYDLPTRMASTTPLAASGGETEKNKELAEAKCDTCNGTKQMYVSTPTVGGGYYTPCWKCVGASTTPPAAYGGETEKNKELAEAIVKELLPYLPPDHLPVKTAAILPLINERVKEAKGEGFDMGVSWKEYCEDGVAPAMDRETYLNNLK